MASVLSDNHPPTKKNQTNKNPNNNKIVHKSASDVCLIHKDWSMQPLFR